MKVSIEIVGDLVKMDYEFGAMLNDVTEYPVLKIVRKKLVEIKPPKTS